MAYWSDFAGSVLGYMRLGLSGVRLKNSSGSLSVRNAGDSADAVILPQSLGTGTRDGTKFLRDDGTWQAAAGSAALNNVISTPTTIPADTSYPVISYLTVNSDLTVSGNLMVIG